ncbi:depupylase/deamidase Dop [Schaalia sp. lx-260]|uniref:depupylase/deamidase Dop n=1 Tax=Schaalia sp. lx-260 TaxID=2899082 RepID=UPI001E30FA85|nr:depupylase/deamidase Dop [Schaalia sp. lx-260]MCD4549566.1 proteasome accessory factor PafA2 [Schaalia sp. lx-260]
MSVNRIIATETEFGIYQVGNTWANPVLLSTQTIRALARRSRQKTPAADSAPVRWDYTAEDPLNDLRGMRMTRAAADPSLLTDDPYHLAPSGGEEHVPRPRAEELALPAATAAVLTNGARVYVDHAHPEYSAPETLGPRDAVLWDRAGELIACDAMAELTQEPEGAIVLVKNNTDGKGAAYGTHENYQVRRDVDLEDIIRGLTPFMVTRPILCGSGRVGIGQRSQKPGFQISQRADFVENEVGLETTFNRPIINTRDEPHADPSRFRRLHVIGGDANLFDYSSYLRFATTSLVLWAIEQGIGLEWEALALDDPVEATWEVSHHPHIDYRMTTAGGASWTAVDMQQTYLDLVRATYERLGIEPDTESAYALTLWQDIIDRMKRDLFSVAPEVEWVAKYQLLSRQKERLGVQWDDPRLVAMDLQWADMRPQRSLVAKLEEAGRVRRMFTLEQVREAVTEPPSNTRAYIRGRAVAHRPDLVKASWTSLVFDSGGADLIRVPLPQAEGVDRAIIERYLPDLPA